MQDFNEFKKLNNIGTLKFYPSKTSDRKVSSFIDTNGVERMLITTESFDPAGPINVVSKTEDIDGNPVDLHYILTNSEGAEPVFTL